MSCEESAMGICEMTSRSVSKTAGLSGALLGLTAGFAAANEPVVPTDMTTQACALLSYHPELGDIPIDTALDGDLQPAYADPTSTILALTVAIAAAQRVAGPQGRVVVRIACDTECVRFIVTGNHADRAVNHVRDDALLADVAAVRWLLASSGGHATDEAGGVTLLLPTLQAARRAHRE